MPGFNIDAFRAAISDRGVQRNNKFLIRFFAPPAFTTAFGTDNENTLNAINREMEYWCEGASIPGVALSLRSVLRYGYGPVEKKPVFPVFHDMDFSIISDAKAENWQFFQRWIQFINNFDFRGGIDPQGAGPSTYELAYKNTYATNVVIEVFDDAGTRSFAIVLREAYPTHVADLPLNWADRGIQRIPVTFTFFDWFNVSLDEPA